MTAATVTLTVGKLAEEVGVSSDAIRHWEREGLLSAAAARELVSPECRPRR
ncbi:MAG TPA: MerR family DNA-binding transcriptional regulator [Glycomyces sp.]